MEQAMKVKELIEILSNFDPDKYVQIYDGMGDYGELCALIIGHFEESFCYRDNAEEICYFKEFIKEGTIMTE